MSFCVVNDVYSTVACKFLRMLRSSWGSIHDRLSVSCRFTGCFMIRIAQQALNDAANAFVLAGIQNPPNMLRLEEVMQTVRGAP